MKSKTRKVDLLCTTFRDGVQGENVELRKIEDFLKTIKLIDDSGLVQYLELGFASSNNGTKKRIKEALKLNLKSKIAAFGRTCENDVKAILDLGVPVGVLVGKSRLRDANVSLNKEGQENLDIIKTSIEKLVKAGLEVIFDAEHSFQSYLEDDKEYFIKVLKTALDAGASRIVLCDTNGGMSTKKVSKVIKAVISKGIPNNKLGVHFHNDRGRAVSNSELAWEEGVNHIQGVFGGFGERTGNLNLCTLIANLNEDYEVSNLKPKNLKMLTEVYNTVCNCLNVKPDLQQPWVGESAFYTEAGMHADGENKDSGSYFHADPKSVGNDYRVGLTDQSGKANIIFEAEKLGINIPKEKLGELVARYNTLIEDGVKFKKAGASFYLWLVRSLAYIDEKDFFQFRKWKLTSSKRKCESINCELVLDMNIKGKEKYKIARGDGPVNTMEVALRKMLIRKFPEISEIKMINFDLEIIDMKEGSAAKVRVFTTFGENGNFWTTTGVHHNIDEASWDAIWDGYFYHILKQK